MCHSFILYLLQSAFCSCQSHQYSNYTIQWTFSSLCVAVHFWGIWQCWLRAPLSPKSNITRSQFVSFLFIPSQPWASLSAPTTYIPLSPRCLLSAHCSFHYWYSSWVNLSTLRIFNSHLYANDSLIQSPTQISSPASVSLILLPAGHLHLGTLQIFLIGFLKN